MKLRIDFDKLVVVGKAFGESAKITLEQGNFATLEPTIKKLLIDNPGKQVYVCGEKVLLRNGTCCDEAEGLNLILVDNRHCPPPFVWNSVSNDISPFHEFQFDWIPTNHHRVWYLGLTEEKFQSDISEEQRQKYRYLNLYTPDNDYWNFKSKPIPFSFPFIVDGEECDLAKDYGDTVKPSTCADPALIHRKARAFIKRQDVLDEEHIQSVEEALVRAVDAETAKHNILADAIATPREVLEDMKVIRVFSSDVRELHPIFDEADLEFKVHTGHYYRPFMSQNYIVLPLVRRSQRVAARQSRVVDATSVQETEQVGTKRSRDVQLEQEIAALALTDAPGPPSPPRKRRRMV